jgi:hypothetical protein
MDFGSRTYYLTLAGFVVVIATFVAVVAEAIQQAEGEPAGWWIAAAALLVLGVVIGVMGLFQPWRTARRLWKQGEELIPRTGWNGAMQSTPSGVTIAVRGPVDDPLPIVLCEVKKRGSGTAYLAYLTDPGEKDNLSIPRAVSSQLVHYPGSFEGDVPRFDSLPYGHYRYVWWYWDTKKQHKVPLVLEAFGMFGAGREELERHKWERKLHSRRVSPSQSTDEDGQS